MIRMARKSVRWSFNWGEWTPTEAEFQRAISCIQHDEKQRLGKFIFRKDSRASLIGRLMMRKFINEYASVPYNEIHLIRDNNNRPVLQNFTELPINFNVSHQGDFTVLAGEVRDTKIGVDVMKLEYTGGKKLSEFFRIMNRNFSDSEWQEIRGELGTREDEKIAMFCRHWALKESYVKALGIGIVVDLGKLDFRTKSSLQNGKTVTDTELYEDDIKQNWLFEETLINSNHCVAVALEKNEFSIISDTTDFEQLDFDNLMKNAIPMFPEDKQYSKEYFAKHEKPSHLN